MNRKNSHARLGALACSVGARLDGFYKERFFEDLYPRLQSMLRDLALRLPRVDLVEVIERYGRAA